MENGFYQPGGVGGSRLLESHASPIQQNVGHFLETAAGCAVGRVYGQGLLKQGPGAIAFWFQQHAGLQRQFGRAQRAVQDAG